MPKSFITLLLLASCYVLSAQNTDTASVGYVTIEDKTLLFFDTILSIDTYNSFNDYSSDDFGTISMGSQGDVRRRLTFYSVLDINPNLGIDGYFKNHQRINAIPFYNVKTPTGGVRTLNGYSKGQMFGLFFTINPISRLNVFIDYERINSTGRYLNQQNQVDRLQVSSSYATSNNFYQAYSALSWNRSVNIEFGGISDLADFEENKFSNRELIPINLSNSASKVRATDFLFNHSFRLAQIDSLTSLRLFHELNYLDEYVQFGSKDSVFTQNAIFNQETVRDSIRLQRVDNYAGVSLNIYQQVLSGGIKYSYFLYGNNYLVQTDNLLSLKLKAQGSIGGLNYIGDWENYFNGSYAGSYQVKFKVNYRPNSDEFNLGAEVKHGLYKPGLFTEKYISNNFIWSNDFKQVLLTELNASIQYKDFELRAGAQQINNHVYFNAMALPEQFVGAMGIYHAEVQGDFKIVGGLRLDNIIRYQTSDNSEIIRIPNWVLRNSLYYQFSAFKKALHSNFGVEFQYFSSFKSESYMPATTVMYLQDQIVIGDFPYFNFFANFKIKEFIIFFKLENITQGLFEYNYYAAPNYPLPDFKFRFGATWRFFN